MKNKQKTIQEQRKKIQGLEVLKPEENKEGNKEETKPVEGLFPKEMRTNEIKTQIDEIKKWEEIIIRKDLKYETSKYRFDF